MSETILVKTALPKPFEQYVTEKLGNGKGRTHLVKQLGSMDKVLELCGDAWIQQLTPKALSKKYQAGYYQIYRFLNEAEPYKDEITNFIKYIDEIRPRNFEAYESIQKWETMIRRSGHLSQLGNITYLRRILGYAKTRYVKNFRCSPEKFDLSKAQEFVDLYLKEHPDKTQLPQGIRLAIRHFLASKSIVIPRGYGAQYGLSGEKQSYGKYAHIKLTDEQVTRIRQITTSDKEALDQGFDIAFEIGIQTCTRAFAIASVQTSKIQEINDLHILRVFEPKVKEGDTHLGKTGKYWTKYISKSLYDRMQQFIKDHPGRTLVFCEKDQVTDVINFTRALSQHLKNIYNQLGITERYFYKHPTHSLRHSGAHRLLKLTNYNYELVSKLGGWTDPKTLRDCYGEMPEDILIQIVTRLGHELNGIKGET